MKMIASTILLFAALGSIAAYADARSDRQAVMRANGPIIGALRANVAAFDAATVKTQGQALVDNAAKIAPLFAAGTDQNDPGASPAIWTDAAGFKAAADKFTADAAAVRDAADGPALQAALATLQSNCGGCHGKYRVAAPPRPAQ